MYEVSAPIRVEPMFSRFLSAEEREFYRRIWYLAGAVVALDCQDQAVEALAVIVASASPQGEP